MGTRRPVVSSRSSLRTSSVMPSPIPNTPRGRLSPLWMSSMPSRGKDVPSTDSVDKSSTDGFEIIRGYLQRIKNKTKNNDQMKIQSFYQTTAFFKATIQFTRILLMSCPDNTRTCLCYERILKCP